MGNKQTIIPMKLGNLPARNFSLVERQELENRIKTLERQLAKSDEFIDYWTESSMFWKVRAIAYKKLLEENGIEIPLETLMSFPRFNPRLKEIQ